MRPLRVALVQLDARSMEHGESLDRGLAACREARDAGADIVLFPEMWQIGYADAPSEREARRVWEAQAIDEESGWIGRFRETAKDLDLAIVATYLQRWTGAPRNAASLIDRHGTLLGTYAKVHTCDFGMEAAVTPGDAFPVFELDTAAGPAKVGIMICYDREFPESARSLMLGGAELILVPNACQMVDDRVFQLRARAYENMVATFLANYADPFDGRSCAFDGRPFTPDGQPRDHVLLELDSKEQIGIASLDLEKLRDYRARGTWGDSYRKPLTYASLAKAGPAAAPFLRSDARGR
jgi:predicted amidohydrolase